MKLRTGLAWVLVVMVLVGCAGRAANPVIAQQYGDDQKNCSAIEQEIAFIESEMRRLMPQTEKAGKNTALGVAGMFFLFPWFMMDLSGAEQVEVDAYRRRYNHLLIIADQKHCGIKKPQIPSFDEASPGDTKEKMSQP